MDSGTVDSAVTLIIKAPNQKYNDQTINCFLNWTVEKLKSHISIVYPSKPLSKDQRLVYSGKLLQDHLQLRDVLRKQDEYHMMHLVCASRSPPASPAPRRPSSPSANTSSSSSSNSEDAGSTSLASSANQDSPPTAPSSSVTGGNDGLRYRGGYPQYSDHITPAAGAMPWPQGPGFPPQAGLGPTSAPHPTYTPMQVLWWQQAYARHYYMQYQAAVAAAQPATAAAPLAAPGPAPSPPPTQPAPPNERMQAALGPNAAPNPLPENPPANANIQMNAQGGAVLNDDELNRDWLDRLYGVSRAGVLLGIVYFYSSFSRFVMVLGAMLLVYLHQAGWFPFRAEQQQALGGGEGGDAAPRGEAERHQDLQEMERLMDEGIEDNDGEEEEGGGAGEGDEEQSQAQTAVQQPGFLTSAWSFISTFFTSLIPEGRPQPVN